MDYPQLAQRYIDNIVAEIASYEKTAEGGDERYWQLVRYNRHRLDCVRAAFQDIKLLQD